MLLFVDQRLHNFTVGVTFARDLNPVPGTYRLCGSFAGIAGNGQNVAISCNSPSPGRYVTIQIIASQPEYLTMCEVKVYGETCEYKCHHFPHTTIRLTLNKMVVQFCY